MKVIMLRLSSRLTQIRDYERASAVANQYFESFPHFNFAYDASIIPFINVLVRSKKYDDAKKQIRILAEAMSQNMIFYDSLDEDDFESSFKDDFRYDLRAINDLVAISAQVEDPDFHKEMEALLGDYLVNQVPN